MIKLTTLQKETMEFLKSQINEARKQTIDIKNIKKRN